MSRGRLLAFVLMATLALSAWLAGTDTPGDDVGVAAGGRRAGETLPPRARSDAKSVAWPAAPAARDEQAWPFDARLARSWVPAPAAVVVAPLRPAAAASGSAGPAVAPAPPFPYALIGRIEDGGAVHALLGGAQRTLGVRAADVIDGQWRVDEIGAAGLTLTWLPGGQRQTLAFRPS